MYVNWTCFTTETWYSRCCCINAYMNNEKNNAYRFRTRRWLSAILETHTKNTHSHTNYVGPPADWLRYFHFSSVITAYISTDLNDIWTKWDIYLVKHSVTRFAIINILISMWAILSPSRWTPCMVSLFMCVDFFICICLIFFSINIISNAKFRNIPHYNGDIPL